PFQGAGLGALLLRLAAEQLQLLALEDREAVLLRAHERGAGAEREERRERDPRERTADHEPITLRIRPSAVLEAIHATNSAAPAATVAARRPLENSSRRRTYSAP